MKLRLITIPSVVLLLASTIHAQEAPAPLPYLSVMPNYDETYQNDKEFDAYEFTNGKSMTHVEGEYWERQYRPKEGAPHASVLQMKRNYANAVKGMGGAVIFDGNDEGGSPILVLKASIEGHTDNVGEAGANKALSQRRATSVVTALKAAGIAPDRLTSAGWGSEKPVADNGTDAGRAKNRRVELVKK